MDNNSISNEEILCSTIVQTTFQLHYSFFILHWTCS